MVFGFLGTVISLERAVALRRAWGYLAPAGTLLGAGLLLGGVRQGIGEIALLLAGCVLAGLFVVILRTHATASAATLFLGTLLWVTGDALWLGGLPLVQVIPWWAGFLVLTIVGEWLELAALGRLTRAGRTSLSSIRPPGARSANAASSQATSAKPSVSRSAAGQRSGSRSRAIPTPSAGPGTEQRQRQPSTPDAGIVAQQRRQHVQRAARNGEWQEPERDQVHCKQDLGRGDGSHRQLRGRERQRGRGGTQQARAAEK